MAGLPHEPPVGLPWPRVAGLGEPGTAAGWTLPRHRKIPSLQVSPVVSSEVHGVMVICPEPERIIQNYVIPRRCRGKLAELAGVLIEREPVTG